MYYTDLMLIGCGATVPWLFLLEAHTRTRIYVIDAVWCGVVLIVYIYYVMRFDVDFMWFFMWIWCNAMLIWWDLIRFDGIFNGIWCDLMWFGWDVQWFGGIWCDLIAFFNGIWCYLVRFLMWCDLIWRDYNAVWFVPLWRGRWVDARAQAFGITTFRDVTWRWRCRRRERTAREKVCSYRIKNTIRTAVTTYQG